MSTTLEMHRFGSSRICSSDMSIIDRLARAAERAIAEQELDSELEVVRGVDGFSINLEGGEATISADAASFPPPSDEITLELAFEIAKTGDMAIITEGGEYEVILTHPSQWNDLPDGWITDRAQAPVCDSAGKLKQLLAGWLDVHSRYTRKMTQNLERSYGNAPARIPGTFSDGLRQFLYVGARATETGLAHLRSASKHYSAWLKVGDNAARRPKAGSLGGTAWRLEIPGGESFYALEVSSDTSAWLTFLREYALSQNRAVGEIIDSQQFILDDGRSFALASCKLTKVKE